MKLIDNIADKSSFYLKNKYRDELPSEQIIRYALKLIILNVIPVLIVVFVATYLNIVPQSITALISFSLLRMFSGGFHFKSAEYCIVFSSLMIIVISKFGFLLSDCSFIMYCVCIVLVMIYAPSKIKEQTRVKEEYFHRFKIISLVIVSLFYIWDNPVSNLAILVQSLLLIYRKGGEK
ncbi:accessory gene regulator B family protein [Paenibacillus polymyxa]|uniref:accessory gene regulator ArgB-like protein n=1 Tax=Paenibacillus polymyxa TaxID=1406 RepID=UPI00287F7C75|nr:accessory gene regulator B family protein [Paenibacillus polymyxa]